MSSRELPHIAVLVAAILERLGVPYEIGGSVASSVHGVPRSTLDVDIVADLNAVSVRRFAEALGGDFYTNAEAMEQAVRAKRSFNVIHLPTMLKVDIFAVKDTPFAQTEFTRRVRRALPDCPETPVWISSAEDIVLHKLLWYEAGGKVAQRQFQDAVGVLRIAAAALDQSYLSQWARTLGVSELLAQARAEAGAAR